jgi:hypothetical protein
MKMSMNKKDPRISRNKMIMFFNIQTNNNKSKINGSKTWQDSLEKMKNLNKALQINNFKRHNNHFARKTAKIKKTKKNRKDIVMQIMRN